MQCTNIPISDDGEQEGTESFLARLTLLTVETPIAPIIVDVDNTTVSILDNDGKSM